MQQIIFVTEIKMKIAQDKHYINSLYYKIEQTAKYCRYLGNQVFQKLNMPLSLEEFATLDTISLYDEICQRDLAKLILKDRPSTGRILNTLEDKNYITRFADTKNNRLVRKMKLTKEGKTVLERATKLLKEYMNNLPEFLSQADIEQLETSIIKFKQGLEKEVEMNI